MLQNLANLLQTHRHKAQFLPSQCNRELVSSHWNQPWILSSSSSYRRNQEKLEITERMKLQRSKNKEQSLYPGYLFRETIELSISSIIAEIFNTKKSPLYVMIDISSKTKEIK